MRRLYKLFIIVCGLIIFTGCGEINKEQQTDNSSVASSYVTEMVDDSENQGDDELDWTKMEKTGSMELSYATEFSVDYYGDYSLVTTGDGVRTMLVPEGKNTPENLDKDITVLQMPVEHIYLVATSAMDMFREIGALDIIDMTGTKPADWQVPGISDMIESGTIKYSGKYNAPDYELILNNGCDLALESTMIYHNPEVKEKLESLGIPVFVERSSYESEPLGRVEWIKLYGLISGKETEAVEFWNDCLARHENILGNVKSDNDENANKKTVFFYISSNGYVVIRKPDDYISKMIKLAGGEYAFDGIVPEEENALSTMNIDMESFYEQAVDADYLIYNSTIDEEIYTIDQLIEKNKVFADFKAVKEGNVWCTGKNMFQETTKTIEVIEDFYNIYNDYEEKINCLHKVN